MRKETVSVIIYLRGKDPIDGAVKNFKLGGEG